VPARPALALATMAPSPAVVRQRLGMGRTLVAALRTLGTSASSSSQIVRALGRLLDLRALRPTDEVVLERATGTAEDVQRVVYRRSDAHAWVVTPDARGGFVANVAGADVLGDPAVATGNPSPSASATEAAPVPRPRVPEFREPVLAGRVMGYVEGQARSLTVIPVDERPVEVATARAFERMRTAARRAGVEIRIVSGFRSMDHQRVLYAQFRAGRGNLAAQPGFSNHQSGHALDLNTSTPGVRAWLEAHARDYGFRRTVPSEGWHWEHW
jgi:hypothetical protein